LGESDGYHRNRRHPAETAAAWIRFPRANGVPRGSPDSQVAFVDAVAAEIAAKALPGSAGTVAAGFAKGA